jgi:hypothetical protein
LVGEGRRAFSDAVEYRWQIDRAIGCIRRSQVTT